MRIENSSTTPIVEAKSKEFDLSKQQLQTQKPGNNEGTTSEESKRNGYTDKALIKTIEEANEKFQVFDRRFEFSVHEKTKEILIKVIDVKTDEVIREIPPEKILDLVAKLCELAGIFVDEKA